MIQAPEGRPSSRAHSLGGEIEVDFATGSYEERGRSLTRRDREPNAGRRGCGAGLRTAGAGCGRQATAASECVSRREKRRAGVLSVQLARNECVPVGQLPGATSASAGG